MKNLKIRTRILLGFASIIVLTGILGILNLYEMKFINKNTEEIATNWMPSINFLGQMKAEALNIRRHCYRYSLATSIEDMNITGKKIVEAEKNLTTATNEFQKLIASDEERQLFNLYKEKWKTYLDIQLRILDETKLNDLEKYKIIINESLEPFDKSLELINKIEVVNNNGAEKEKLVCRAEYKKATAIIISVITIVIITSIIIGFMISTSISKGIKKVQISAQKLAIGDLNIDLQVESKDEVGMLVQDFK